jgi:hypothetical protein
MPIIKTKRGLERQAIKAIHHPPKATDTVKVSKEMQDEKRKMVRELIPFLMYLYKKHMGAQISEGVDLDMMKLINKAMRQMPGSPAQKKTLDQLNKLRKSAGMKPIGEDINIPISVGDTILGGKFKNKRIVVKSIGKNEKGDITINGKPLLKYRILDEDLRKWFGKGKTGSTDGGGWDRYSSDGKKLGKCGDGKEGDAYAACLSKEKAAKLGPDGRASFVRRKRADQKKSGDTKKGGNRTKGKTPTFSKTKANESSINEFGGVKFDLIGYDSNNKPVLKTIKRASDSFMKDVAKYGSEKLFKSGKGVEYVKIYYDKNHLATVKDGGRSVVKEKGWSKLPINEIPMGDLQKIDQFADKKLNPVDVVLTDKHFFDRLNDPRNGKEISQAELIGFFKRLSKHKKEFVEFLEKYNSVVAVDDRTNINIPFMKQANKAIAKTVMRKKDFKTPDKKLDI